uniref:Reverse transcriptase zinc-binding domain-containing protein n=1 Tax=Lactuca sativa TaxID=4236 RepID=A0A9R1UQF2_LACSA|nr:hypothetical protein LSAT_V11C800442200 [Lactuca sativa]
MDEYIQVLEHLKAGRPWPPLAPKTVCHCLWAWKRHPKNPQELLDLDSIVSLTSQVVCSNRSDAWRSRLAVDDIFHLTVSVNNPTVWFHLVPIKCISFVWRTCMGRIPTAMTLSKRGIKISSISCQICSNGVDIADHILLECPDAVDSLVWIFIWCGIPFQRFRLISDFVNFAVIWGKCSKNRKIFIAIRYGFLWCM